MAAGDGSSGTPSRSTAQERSRGLLEDITKTPAGAEGVSDEDYTIYLYSEQSLLDWLKDMPRSVAAADYGAKLISAGFDSCATMCATREDLKELGLPLGHARIIADAAAGMQAGSKRA